MSNNKVHYFLIYLT